jgi:hypothetical protein
MISTRGRSFLQSLVALEKEYTYLFPSDNRYIINPAILDSCLHVLVHPIFTGDTDQSTYYLPSRIREVVLHADGKLPAILYSHSNFREWHPGTLARTLYL